jgi:hypothetical protein
MIKDHINQAGGLVIELAARRTKASAWQQAAIDRVTPLLRELASNTEATIEHLDKNQSRLHRPELQEYAKANYELATRLAAPFLAGPGPARLFSSE